MKVLTLALATAFLLTSQVSIAHDEGHGPKLGDQPKFGGKVAAVINKNEIQKGAKATMIYKAELTKNNQNIVRVYLYDKTMKLMKVDNFGTAVGELQFKDRKTRKWVSQELKFEKKNGLYQSKLAGSPRRPFNIDVTIEHKEQKLFMAFDGLN